jgi:adenylate cyclase
MADLQARSLVEPDRSWRRALAAGPVVVSRTQLSEGQLEPGAVCWTVDWDGFVSNPHAFLSWDGTILTVRRRVAPTKTTNPVVFGGKEVDEFAVGIGGSFQIGDTIFTLCESSAVPEPHERGAADVTEVTYSRRELQAVRYSDADRRIEALAGLPELIRMSASDEELEAQVVQVLLSGIPGAAAAAVVRLVPGGGSEPAAVVSAAACRDNREGEMRPSRRLVDAAIRQRRQSVLHVWRGSATDDVTVDPGADWAICAPLLDDLSPDSGLYVTGRFPRVGAREEAGLDLHPGSKGDLKFAELTADMFASLRATRDLQRQVGILSRFLSTKVQTAMAGRNVEELLRPRRMPVTVLFCDLRGSCRIAEGCADDLDALWETFGEALGIMTGAIVEYDGVIGDFQGDATMGFWGWPLGDDRQVEQACRAALNIRKRFAQIAQTGNRRLGGFACGIGVAHGPAIAGRIGTPDQYKLGVFGPVVNLAARLESLTKRVGVPVLIDGATADAVPASVEFARRRRVGKVRPAGMTRAIDVHELLPPVVEPGTLAEGHRLSYEAAVEAFQAGSWADAQNRLKYLLRIQDGPSLFLKACMDGWPDGPQTGWDGVICLNTK